MCYTLGGRVIISCELAWQVWFHKRIIIAREFDSCRQTSHYSIHHCAGSLLYTFKDIHLIDTGAFLWFSEQIHDRIMTDRVPCCDRVHYYTMPCCITFRGQWPRPPPTSVKLTYWYLTMGACYIASQALTFLVCTIRNWEWPGDEVLKDIVSR